MAGAANEKRVKAITSRAEDFAQWYTDVVLMAELVDYASIRGCIVFRPLGYALWENIQADFNNKIKKTGHYNVYMPMFIPESLLAVEQEHVEGFAPEVAWVTHGGSEELQERMCVRPTSEVLFCEHYKKTIQSHRDLPKLYNQWCSVVRWEKTTRPFLRNTEFLWQEGHTAHATNEDSLKETLMILDFYEEVFRDLLAIPVIKGQKTDMERFAGARETYTLESLMYDKKALQSATSHNFSDNFAKAFDIKYTDNNNELKYVHQTSWGLSTRSLGAIIMVHGDDDGLVLPPRVAPVQVVIIPIATHKGGVLDKAEDLLSSLDGVVRATLDKSDKTPGWKFAEHEMKGVPLRVELGPKDIERGIATVVRRDNSEKLEIPIGDLPAKLPELLEQVQADMLERASALLRENTHDASSLEELAQIGEQKGGFINAMWCGERACEQEIKDSVGLSSRCIPFQQKVIDSDCVVCGKPAAHCVVWGKAY